MVESYTALRQSSKIGLCGLPISIDSYSSCTFGCKYCFANNRDLGKQPKFKIANLSAIAYRLKYIFETKKFNHKNLLNKLIEDGITWHLGGMSDPFQAAEYNFNITRDLIKITKRYGISILFSTKTDMLYDCYKYLDKDLHTFQLSITNLDNRTDLECNVPPIEKRIKLFKDLKNEGFRVGIRIQPFIPEITKTDIIDEFREADYFTIEGLKIVPTNLGQREELFNLLPYLNDKWFVNYGLLNLRPEIRHRLYEPFIEKLNSHNIPFSIADNDMHNISSGYCCCGDILVKKSTPYNSTAMIKKYGDRFTAQELATEIRNSGMKDCKTRTLFVSTHSSSSARKYEYMTLQERLCSYYNDVSNALCPSFIYKNNNLKLF